MDKYFYIRDAKESDLALIEANIREADQIELEYSSGSVSKALRYSFLSAFMCRVCECEAGIVAIYGVSPLSWSQGVGSPWLIGTRLLEGRHKRALLLFGKPIMNEFKRYFPGRLENYVHVDNDKSIRWLRWLGFSFGEPETYGVAGQLFLPFWWEAEKQCANQH